MRQGAVGQVRVVEHRGQPVVEKRFRNRFRLQVEVLALSTLAHQDLPVPELIEVRTESIVMTLMPGERLDSGNAELRLERLHASASWLRRLHERPPPHGLQPAPDDAMIIRRYRDAGGPPLPLVIPPAGPLAFCHGDWTDGNVLAVGTDITAIVDWEAAHMGDPLRELSRAVWEHPSKTSGRSMLSSRATEPIPHAYGPGSRSTPPNFGCGSPKRDHPSTSSNLPRSSLDGPTSDSSKRRLS